MVGERQPGGLCCCLSARVGRCGPTLCGCEAPGVEARCEEAAHAIAVVLVGWHGCGALDRQWGDARVCNETAAGG